ncbi:MAG: glycosyltransferase family 39 protein, partial [Candidatus Delongbacteria bacterium]|nr:glycosyltransferase family 39 protein [Candidatus Delongbacteria bacterium]
MKILNNKPFLVFILFLSIFLLFSNGRITSSMDVDVVKYSQNLIDSSNLGSETNLSNGTVYSPKTHLFYPLEGLGIIFPVAMISYISDLFGVESTFLIFSTGAIFFALTLMFMFKLFSLFVSEKKSLIYVALLGLATPIFAMSKMLFPEPFVMLAISGSIYYYFKYTKDKLNLSLLLCGLFTGLTLIMRPDSPIFYILTIILLSVKLFKENDRSKKYIFFLIGIAVFTFVFFINNFIKFGSILETGYTINKYQRAEVLSSLEDDLKKLPTKLQSTLASAQISVEKDKSSEESQSLVKRYYSLDKSLKDKTAYLGKLKESENYRINGVFA